VADVPLPPIQPVTRAKRGCSSGRQPGHAESVLASHVPTRFHGDQCACRSVRHFGAADHHGIYEEPTFQSVLLRLLLRPPRPRATNAPLAAAR
jgi:hypothetical protein